MEEKSLDRWRFEIKSIGKKHWLTFYEHFMGYPCSNPMRFYRAINLYGELIVLEAVLDSSMQDLNGDGLSYVLKVASNKWKTNQQQNDADSEYEAAINAAKKATILRNKSLESKLKSKRKRK